MSGELPPVPCGDITQRTEDLARPPWPSGLRFRLFAVGDYIAGGAIGAATAVGVGTCVSPGMHMAIAMPAGMLVGTAVSLTIGLLLSPLLGVFYVLVPGSLIGMYGGMPFAMWASLQAAPMSLGKAMAAGLVFGLTVSGAVRLGDRVLRGPATRAGRS